MRKTFVQQQKGFTLVEIMVSLSIFSLVAVTSTASLLAVIDANTKTQTLKSVSDNLNVAVENMSRVIRLGTDYQCYDGSSAQASCQTGSVGIKFIGQDQTTSQYTAYYFGTQPDPLNAGETVGAIYRDLNGTVVPLTAPEVDIDPTQSKFYLIGQGIGDDGQPRALIIIKGTAGLPNGTKSTFNIQTSISQRTLDRGTMPIGSSGTGDGGTVEDPEPNTFADFDDRTYYMSVDGYGHTFTINSIASNGAFTATGTSGVFTEQITGTLTANSIEFTSQYYRTINGSLEIYDYRYRYVSTAKTGDPYRFTGGLYINDSTSPSYNGSTFQPQ